MQLPAIPLNTKHNFPYVSSFKLDAQYQCYLEKELLRKIKLVCDDPEFYRMFGGDPNPNSSRVQENYSMEYSNEYSDPDIQTINTNAL